jgi:cytidyltransferase-related domain
MRTAIYPGTFDPITYGHIDVIKKSLKIFDRVVIAAAENINKDYLFSVDERIDIIKNSLIKDLKMNKKKIPIILYTSQLAQ